MLRGFFMPIGTHRRLWRKVSVHIALVRGLYGFRAKDERRMNGLALISLYDQYDNGAGLLVSITGPLFRYNTIADMMTCFQALFKMIQNTPNRPGLWQTYVSKNILKRLVPQITYEIYQIFTPATLNNEN